ncbi:MAG: hypothetical protein NC218_09645 [Acetobacter sp.]|nr:hypothetical protein [Acetobacter sp.]
MINPVYQSGNKSYGVNHYAVDTESDVSKLPTYCAMGSSATVIATGAKYMLNSNKQWVKQPTETAGGSGSGGSGSGSTGDGDDIIVLNPNTPSTGDDDIIILNQNTDDSILIL